MTKKVIGYVLTCLVSKFDKKFQKEVSQIADKKSSCAMILGDLSLQLSLHLKCSLKPTED